jgi:hypothetical protein
MSTRHAAEPSESPEPISRARIVEEHAKAASDGVSARAWQLGTLLVPILLTSWLTYWVSQKEDGTKQHIDQQSQIFSQQLQLSEELYKRRFDAYEKLYAQLVEINGKLEEQSGIGDFSKINADQVAQFNELMNVSKLHMSPKVDDLTYGAWLAGVRQDGPLLSKNIRELETQMKRELDNWMLAEKGEVAADAAASKPKKSSKAKIRSAQ